MSLNSILWIKKVLSEESYHGVGAMMWCSSKCYQHFPCEMTRLFIHKFWYKSFEKRSTHMLDIPKRLHRKGNYNCAKFVMFQEKDVCETASYKIMGIFR
jgi:hypothetical protein